MTNFLITKRRDIFYYLCKSKKREAIYMSVLVIRFSSISNVSMVIPLLDSLARNYQDRKFVVLSRFFLSPLFENLKNVEFASADIRGVHKGIGGAFLLFKELKKEHTIDTVIDLQNDFRSLFIRILFRLSGIKVYFIAPNRKEEWKLLLWKNKIRRPLKSLFERYKETFEKAHLYTDDEFDSLHLNQTQTAEKITTIYGEKQGKWIGIAPFAQAKGKLLPLKKTKEVIDFFDKKGDCKIFLFGAGEVENEILLDWETIFNNVHAVHTSLKLGEELELIRQLDVMLSMESANMHLASLVKTPVVSVWGSTHHFAGNLGWKQSEDNIIGIDLPCRPCSINGTNRCKKNTFECLQNIDTKIIIQKILETINR